MTKLWFSYSLPQGITLDSDEPSRSPYHHSWYVGRFLREKAQERGWEFEYVNLDDDTTREIGADDVIVGHAWFTENAFMIQASRQECKARFILQPYTEKMVGPEALDLLHEQWGAADHLFLNCGPYWYDRMPDSDYAKYHQKVTRLDNFVNPVFHPFKKTKWNEPGKRGVLAIGYDNPIKGMDKVEELARVAGLRLLHCGSVAEGFFKHVPQAISMSGMVFDEHNIEWICEHYDMFITMGRFDANPTTLSETALWGLIPACTEQSGYYANDPFVNLKLDDIVHNLEVIEWFQYASVPELEEMQKRIRNYVLEYHTHERRIVYIWDRMLEYIE